MSNDSVNMHMFIQTLSGRRLPTAVIQSRKKQKNRPMKRAPKSEPFFHSKVMYKTVRTHLFKGLHRVCVANHLLKNKKATRGPFNMNTWREKTTALCVHFSHNADKNKKEETTPYRLAYRSWSIWSRVCAETTIDKRRKKKQVCTRCTHRFCTTRQWLLKKYTWRKCMK